VVAKRGNVNFRVITHGFDFQALTGI
jgi:hypothetical protein